MQLELWTRQTELTIARGLNVSPLRESMKVVFRSCIVLREVSVENEVAGNDVTQLFYMLLAFDDKVGIKAVMSV